eukprot:366021-Chlamydomonas_euryale.AAC.5
MHTQQQVVILKRGPQRVQQRRVVSQARKKQMCKQPSEDCDGGCAVLRSVRQARQRVVNGDSAGSTREAPHTRVEGDENGRRWRRRDRGEPTTSRMQGCAEISKDTKRSRAE